MASIQNEPLDLVLTNYPIKVLDIRSESYKDKKGVWWIKTAEGMKILKKVSNSEETLKFTLHTVFHLQKNGIRLPRVNKTIDGKDYVNINGTCFVLTDAIEGKNPTYSSPRELHSIVSELARFHNASEGFTAPSNCKPKYHLGLWVEDYKAQLEEIDEFYKNELAKKENDAIGNTLLKEFPYFYDRAIKAIEGLTGPEYEEWAVRAAKAGSLCHQDFAAGNLIMSSPDVIYVIDTDSITVDIAARDIRKLLNKVMKKNGRWDTELARTMFRSYQSINPLTPSQWHVVKLDLMFPHLFIGAVNKYIYKRDKEWSFEKYHQRIVEMASFERTLLPVLEHFESIIPK